MERVPEVMIVLYTAAMNLGRAAKEGIRWVYIIFN